MKAMVSVALVPLWLLVVASSAAAGQGRHCRSDEQAATLAPGDADYVKVTGALRRFADAADAQGFRLPRQFLGAPGAETVAYRYSRIRCSDGPEAGREDAAGAGLPPSPGDDAPPGANLTITTCAGAVRAAVEYHKTAAGWTVERATSERVRACEAGGSP